MWRSVWTWETPRHWCTRTLLILQVEVWRDPQLSLDGRTKKINLWIFFFHQWYACVKIWHSEFKREREREIIKRLPSGYSAGEDLARNLHTASYAVGCLEACDNCVTDGQRTRACCHQPTLLRPPAPPGQARPYATRAQGSVSIPPPPIWNFQDLVPANGIQFTGRSLQVYYIGLISGGEIGDEQLKRLRLSFTKYILRFILQMLVV